MAEGDDELLLADGLRGDGPVGEQGRVDAEGLQGCVRAEVLKATPGTRAKAVAKFCVRTAVAMSGDLELTVKPSEPA